MRYLRAFFMALWFTLRGKKIEAPANRYPDLQIWIQEALRLLDEADKAATNSGVNLAARKALILRLDGREWSMELILSSLRFHLSTEYPSLLNAIVEHNLTTFYALNLDDQYRVAQLAESEKLPEVLKSTLRDLAQHLQAIPSSKKP